MNVNIQIAHNFDDQGSNTSDSDNIDFIIDGLSKNHEHSFNHSDHIIEPSDTHSEVDEEEKNNFLPLDMILSKGDQENQKSEESEIIIEN